MIGVILCLTSECFVILSGQITGLMFLNGLSDGDIDVTVIDKLW